MDVTAKFAVVSTDRQLKNDLQNNTMRQYTTQFILLSRPVV
jgi:hypothetical protein